MNYIKIYRPLFTGKVSFPSLQRKKIKMRFGDISLDDIDDHNHE